MIQEYRVLDLCNALKCTVESAFGIVKVKGEISGLKIATSGHAYFTLKDQDATITSTCWKSALSKVSFKLEDGLQVVATGKVSIYAPQSKYQLSVDKIEADGIGSLMQLLQQRKMMFANEGLFDAARKKNLPFLPDRIAIVTSLSGAVICDIIHRIRDRFPLELFIWPVAVQGSSAAQEITQAIDNINTLNDKPDLIIIARGGGSIEDLWCFNEESVVRAVSRSIIPIISAVGHETDFTLIDFVSDVRAPTPTAAAEFAVPVLADLYHKLVSIENSAVFALTRLVKYHHSTLEKYSLFINKSLDMIRYKQQRLDEVSMRLDMSLPKYLQLLSARLNSIQVRSKTLTNSIIIHRNQVENVLNRLRSSINVILVRYQQNLKLQSELLSSLDLQRILERGFCIVRSNCSIITSVSDMEHTLENNLELNIQFADGKINVNLM